MSLAGIGDIIRNAPAGVGAFNVVQLEHAEAIVAGAEAAGTPVVLQISENCVRYHGALAPIAAASLAVARAAAVPVAVHLDHATDRALVEEAIALGVGSVMFDASALPDEENVALTAEVAAHCHAHGLWVEAELGEIGGKDGVHAPGARTRPHEAVDYVARTGVDALAVAVGSSHAMTTRDAVLDLELISALRAAVPVPLVLHGSSGVPDDTLRAAVRHGMKKINIATHLNRTFTGTIRDHLAADARVVDSRVYLSAARTAVATEVTRLLGVLN
ncbi:class II fructose-bisphosphate aldolase [Streptosporangium saharense]|uniref:class II fructose-bisphosphate aldolase n=1 Tax=Streptosporangium saharense TaxID=1706840 RepID=UPI0036B7AA7E